MKKAALYLFVAFLSVSCNQGKDNPFNQQKNNPFNQQKNNTTKSTWSKDFSAKFISDCVTSATGELGSQQAQTYCSCMADKISKKYPDENDAKNKMTKEDVENLKGGCLGNQSNNNQNNNQNNNNNNNNQNQKQWSNDDQSAFLGGCVSSGIKTMDAGTATQLCDCLLQKLMQEYPNRAAANSISQEHSAELETQCMGAGKGKN